MSRLTECPHCGASARQHTGSYCQECGENLLPQPRQQTQPVFAVGDRCFSHYTRHLARGISGWGTIERVDHTRRGATHGVTGSPLPDTTWYTVRTDEGGTEYLDCAHGNLTHARIVTPDMARRYGYGEDPRV